MIKIKPTEKDDIKINEEKLNLNILIRKINRERGFDCNHYRTSYIKRRILTRLRANLLDNLEDYLRFLDKNPEEYNALLNALTINVTNFFRDKSVYELFKKNVLPKIIDKKKNRGQRMIRIWSAGCASGEEAYSIAMLVRDAIGLFNDEIVPTIIATDYDKKSLKIAKLGIYQEEKLKNVNEKHRRRYFKYDGDYRVKPILKSMVKFKNLDLFADNPIKYVDAIFCRNVLIYFTRDEQKELISKFYSSLVDKGYLILGKSEKLVSSGKDFLVLNGPERIYQKINKYE